MPHINLLPWRQEERIRRNKEFIVVIAAVTLLALLTAFATWSYFDNELEEQRREDIISRMQVIQDLQGRRPVPVSLWDDIAKAIPPALYLNNLKREGDLITLTGQADNPNVVSELIRNLDSSSWMGNSAVRNVQQNITAYQAVPEINAPVTDGEQPRPIYPEDSYVQFVITTQVQPLPTTETDSEAFSSDTLSAETGGES